MLLFISADAISAATTIGCFPINPDTCRHLSLPPPPSPQNKKSNIIGHGHSKAMCFVLSLFCSELLFEFSHSVNDYKISLEWAKSIIWLEHGNCDATETHITWLCITLLNMRPWCVWLNLRIRLLADRWEGGRPSGRLKCSFRKYTQWQYNNPFDSNEVFIL